MTLELTLMLRVRTLLHLLRSASAMVEGFIGAKNRACGECFILDRSGWELYVSA